VELPLCDRAREVRLFFEEALVFLSSVRMRLSCDKSDVHTLLDEEIDSNFGHRWSYFLS